MTRSTMRRAASLCGTTAAGIACPLQRAASGLPEAERLVGYGFRFWMHGQRSGDIRSWETAWSLYCGMFGPTRARLAVGALSDWVGALGLASRREIEVGAVNCSAFCRDECLAISMIAACQHRTCPAMRACAFALIECGHIDTRRVDDVAAPAQTFADTLQALDQVLLPSSIVTAAGVPPPLNRRPS